MFQKFRGIFGAKSNQDPHLAALENAAREAIADLDFDDPAVRTGVSLQMILSKQFDLIGKPEGEFPYTPPFATDKARGALLGTSIAIVRQQFGDFEQEAVTDAAVAAFSLTYGSENGRFYALQTLKDSSDGNVDVNFASDWAIRDTDSPNSSDGIATPVAFYLAVAEML